MTISPKTMAEISRRYQDLASLWLNIIRWDTNSQWRKSLTDFVPPETRQLYRAFDPREYRWSAVEAWLTLRFGYDRRRHVLAFVQYGLQYDLEEEDRRRVVEVDGEDAWDDVLCAVAERVVFVPPGGELLFMILPVRGRGQGEGLSRGRVLERAQGWYDDVDDVGGIKVVEYDWGSDSDEAEGEEKKEVVLGIAEEARAPPGPTRKVTGVVKTAAPKTAAPRTPVSKAAGNVPKTANNLPRTTQPTTRSTIPRGTPTTRPTPARGTRTTTTTTPPKATTTPPTVTPTRTTRRAPFSRTPTTGTTTSSSSSSTTPKSTSTSTPTSTPRKRPPPPKPADHTTLMDLLTTDYHTSSTSDTDYGAIDPNAAVDTYLGSYDGGIGGGNNKKDNGKDNGKDNDKGSSTKEWNAVLDFFCIDPGEYAKREKREVVAAAAAAASVPMKKLPGMTVGLFDYQLAGVVGLLRFILKDVSGGLLCDEQGLGKTQEMYGLIAFAQALRKSKAEVKAAWRKGAEKKKAGTTTTAVSAATPTGKGRGGGPSQHNPPGTTEARGCPFDERYGFRCYCYSALTRELADRIPDGPNIVVAPGRNCAGLVRDAKTKLDTKVFKIRGFHDGASKEDGLAAADVKALGASVTVRKSEVEGKDGRAGFKFKYQAVAGQSDYIIVVSPEYIARLNNQITVDLRLESGERAKKSALLPGMILLDEFHEYAIARADNPEHSHTVAWLMHLKKCCLDSSQLTPLTYFVSGTPLGQTPLDIRPAVALLEKTSWHDKDHPLRGATDDAFDSLVHTFDRLTAIQAAGDVVDKPSIVDYRRRLDNILRHTMIRRLGTDQFQGRNLTDLGPLQVHITDHQLPDFLVDSVQTLAFTTRDLVKTAAATHNMSVPRFLRNPLLSEPLLLKLRLTSLFPSLAASPVLSQFTFSPSELATFLGAAQNDITKTPYYPHIPSWSAASPKLTTLTATIQTMLSDRTPVPGAAAGTTTKKMCIFTPTEAEAVLLHAYLHLARSHPTFSSSSAPLKPILLHTSLPPSTTQSHLTKFLTPGHSPPNILISPLSLAGTGLNLQQAKYSTVTGPAWTKRENQQAFYRIHRVGQRQETQLGLLVGGWNPVERLVLRGYETQSKVEGGNGGDKDGESWEEGEMWVIGNGLDEGGERGGLVDRHQEKK
ncbi:hypothetical protein B0J18DRAFT_402535 [Chaetomium sp. MPI-SDFR-AT-0129]|nr:hypothetical protein B0J18DRAFT_402535 [Chaetomium sp. MPI-SDFR-AT-0129]